MKQARSRLGCRTRSAPYFRSAKNNYIDHVINYILEHAKSDQRPYLTVDIFGYELQGLLDSGANHTVMGSPGQTFIDGFGVKLEPDDTICTVANGQTVRSKLDDAVDYLTSSIQEATWSATPNKSREVMAIDNYSTEIEKTIGEKLKTRKTWQNTQDATTKNKLNTATRELKNMLKNSKTFSNYIENASLTIDTEYSL